MIELVDWTGRDPGAAFNECNGVGEYGHAGRKRWLGRESGDRERMIEQVEGLQ